MTNTLSLSLSLSSNTSADGLVLLNPNTASLGNQQHSPRLRFTGQGWKTNASAASQQTDWTIENIPGQGVSNALATLTFSSQINGAGYDPLVKLFSDGKMLLGQNAVEQTDHNTVLEVGGYTGSHLCAAMFINGSGNDPTISVWNLSESGDAKLNRFLVTSSATEKGSIVWSSSTNTTNYNTTSDSRLKKNINDAVSASTIIDGIRVRSFDWIEGGQHVEHWLIAQELYNVAPAAVTKPLKEQDWWQIDTSKLVPLLIKEIQDLRKRVSALEQS